MQLRDRSSARYAAAPVDAGYPGNEVHDLQRWVIPPSAPLPSLTNALSRRAALFGVVSATGFLAAAGTAALGKGDAVTALPPALDTVDTRFVEMQRQAMALKAYSDHPDTHGELGDAAYARASDIQHDAIDMTVATPVGALASLLWGREEFARYYVDEAETPDWLDRFTLKMMDNAIAVLRAEVSNG